MSLIVKICGLKTPEALDVALESGADLVGFVFFAPSPAPSRARGRARAWRTRQGPRRQGRAHASMPTTRRLPPSSRRSSPTCCNCTAPRRPSGCRRCAARFGLPVMKALPIASASDLAAVNDYATGRRLAAFRCARARRRHAARRPRQAVRLDLTQGRRSRCPVHAVGRARRRQCRGGACESRERPPSTCPPASRARRRQGPRQNSCVHPRRASSRCRAVARPKRSSA